MVEINISKTVHHMTLDIKVTGRKVFAARLSVGTWLLKLGCKVIGCQVHISTEWDDAVASMGEYGGCPPMPKCKPPKEPKVERRTEI